MADQPTNPDEDLTTDATKAADEADARTFAQADRMPTPDEERLADEASAEVDGDTVAAHYQEMADLGARAKGEGRIEP